MALKGSSALDFSVAGDCANVRAGGNKKRSAIETMQRERRLLEVNTFLQILYRVLSESRLLQHHRAIM
jgi:hypothetical protein